MIGRQKNDYRMDEILDNPNEKPLMYFSDFNDYAVKKTVSFGFFYFNTCNQPTFKHSLYELHFCVVFVAMECKGNVCQAFDENERTFS